MGDLLRKGLPLMPMRSELQLQMQKLEKVLEKLVDSSANQVIGCRLTETTVTVAATEATAATQQDGRGAPHRLGQARGGGALRQSEPSFQSYHCFDLHLYHLELERSLYAVTL